MQVFASLLCLAVAFVDEGGAFGFGATMCYPNFMGVKCVKAMSLCYHMSPLYQVGFMVSHIVCSLWPRHFVEAWSPRTPRLLTISKHLGPELTLPCRSLWHGLAPSHPGASATWCRNSGSVMRSVATLMGAAILGLYNILSCKNLQETASSLG